MSSASHSEGLEIARRLISQEAEARTGVLDLGRLGLTAMPEGLEKLTHLKALNLGARYDSVKKDWRGAAHRFEKNDLRRDWEGLGGLVLLKELHCQYAVLTDLSPLARLTTLNTLNCSGTQVSDLKPLGYLKALTMLNCWGTQVSDLKPLEQLKALTTLNCSGTQVSDLKALGYLKALTSLDCSGGTFKSSQVSDLKPLEQLKALTTLNCSNTQVSDLAPLAQLTALTTLDCSGGIFKPSQVRDLTPLAQLTALTTLKCARTQVSDLKPLARLTALTTLDCSGGTYKPSQVSDLTPLAQLTALTVLNCSGAPVSDLTPLAQLTALTSLGITGTRVSDLKALEQLKALTTLNCSGTPVSDLKPLEQLKALTTLYCSGTQVSDLKPLEQLKALTTLYCSGTQVSDLKPLEQLTALTTLDCSETHVINLKALEQLKALTELNCSETQVSDLPGWLVWRDTLRQLYTYGLRIEDTPGEVLSKEFDDDCLESLRCHLKDLAAGEELLPDVKVIVIGNGRIGKTQICRRLRGEEFETEADSTHGITVTCAPLDVETPTRLHLWDFGGQDLYHGTHALFMKTRAVFVLVWTPGAESAGTHEHGGMVFRNEPLAYWLGHVRHLGGMDSPLLVVQNQCDVQEDELLRPPVADEVMEGFGFCKLLHYSARLNRKRAALDEELREAVQWLRMRQGQARIGKGRMAVKRRLEALRDADAALPVAQRRHRLLSQEYYRELCAEAGGVSSPEMLLEYLHQCGIVFYRKGLFGDQIVLDQAWALEAVYAVFNRTRCYKQLRQLGGRFTRTLLEALVWQDYSEKEQKLFLSLMESCGTCFVHRQGNYNDEVETEYIAPDLLPERGEVAAEIEARWPADAPQEEVQFEFPFLHAGVVRSVIARVGREAGMMAVYWRDGVYGYERGTRCHLLLEVRRVAGGETGQAGSIVVRASGAQPLELLRRVEKWIAEEGLRNSAPGYRLFDAKTAGRRKLETMTEVIEGPDGLEVVVAEPKLEFDLPTPAQEGLKYCVSYAWREDSTQVVNELCKTAEVRGIHILRDTSGLGLGKRISQFMHRLADGDRIFIILSDKYLKSLFCMTELFEVWRNSRGREEDFLGKVRVYRLPDAAMMTPVERAKCAVYWKQEFEELDALVKQHGAGIQGEPDFKRYKLMQDFAHRVGDILALIADTLLPKNFEELVKSGFGE